MILGHIGVRAGSKGLPGKNMKMLLGKPLLQWSLDQLLEHPLIDAVVVSTDGTDMLKFATERGAIDIGLRPDELANDTASKWDVWRHALAAVEQVTGKSVSVFVDVDATAPLRQPIDITNAVELFQAEKPDMVMTCAIADRNPYFNLMEADETGALHVSKPMPGNVVARQQAPVVYEHAASTYVLDPAYLRRGTFLYDGRVIPCVVPSDRAHDIDAIEDFEYAEWRLSRQMSEGKK
ncbi:acylneuraminate cytidylyltransferase [Amylibacter ulvae]|uniref:Acylneuraminate cytidylyltransferase n=1 Tax=Paramylibacter ulvae TaxID=1651968 RepID=A0ABQ3CYT8_9RHOB|nr:acylneuraminate cytidylyltransferase family protein [Amylibacter ulvae]GHA50476.1 acylneuraminate cytidylyltransferase [Amylibacter ulvae]